MNPLEHQIVDALEAASDGHATAFNVFNVLNRDGFNVTKQEFERACQHLHDHSSVTYRPIRSSLIDIPIGTLDLRMRTPKRESSVDEASNSTLNVGQASLVADGEQVPVPSSGRPTLAPQFARAPIYAG
jgi:hypothetical protein